MECAECAVPVADTVLVTFTTGRTEELPLCTECETAYREGTFVSTVSEGRPDTGGESQNIAKCTDCGEIYPAQMSPEDDLRPVGLEDGTCVCGNAEFRPLVER